jgi:uncharacterized protein YacL
MFTGRTLSEIVVLLFAITACIALLLTGATVAAIVLIPEVNDERIALGPTVDFLQTSIGLIIGALLGLLVNGRSSGTPIERPNP